MTTYIHFGNNCATQKLSNGEIVDVPGELVTEVIFPDSVPEDQMCSIALAALQSHQSCNSPEAVFVQSNDPVLEGILVQELGIEDNVVPEGYGDMDFSASLLMPYRG